MKEHESPQANSARSHRGSYGHLARALVYGLGNHGVKTRGRERQGDNRQDSEHRAVQAHVIIRMRDIIGERTQTEYWKVRIQVLHALPKGGGEARRSDSRPCGDDHVTPRVLPVRQIYSWKSLAVAVLNDISRNANNRRPGFVSLTIHANAFPKRGLAGPMPVGKALIDDRRLVTSGSVKLRELASHYQLRLHAAEISGTDGQHGCPGPIAHVGYRRSFNLKRVRNLPKRPAAGQLRHDRSNLDAWQRAEAGGQLLEK